MTNAIYIRSLVLSERVGINALPVREITVSLGSLSTEVGQVAGEQKVVLGSDSQSVTHEGTGVKDQSAGHGTRDTAEMLY